MYQFYSMKLSKAEIEKYLKEQDFQQFKGFIIQFYHEENKDGANYKMRGWVLQKDFTAVPESGNLLAEGSVVTTNIKSPFYFSSCEISREEFKKDILDKAGGLSGDWDMIMLTPLQNVNGYLFVELSINLPGFGTIKTVTNPRPPYS